MSDPFFCFITHVREGTCIFKFIRNVSQNFYGFNLKREYLFFFDFWNLWRRTRRTRRDYGLDWTVVHSFNCLHQNVFYFDWYQNQ